MNELYVLARRVLLDALDALADHHDALILVGAQAIYLHTGAADLAVAEFTTDVDLILDPELLRKIPPLEQALQAAGFFTANASAVGVWTARKSRSQHGIIDVDVDLMVPSTVSPGTGRRAARLQGHDPHVARKVHGLEGALIDHTLMEIGSLEPTKDTRVLTAKVAGLGALLMSKLFKINERQGSSRSNDKDALDVLRIMQSTDAQQLAQHLELIRADTRFTPLVHHATHLLNDLFGRRSDLGATMAARAVEPLIDEDEIRITCEFLTQDLLLALKP